MALAHPALTTLGHRPGKPKFRSAQEAQRHRELEAQWAENQRRWSAMSAPGSRTKYQVPKPILSPKVPPGRSTTSHIPSVTSTHLGAVASKAPQQYTGTKMIGIGTLHKSNAVPIFSDEEAQDIAKMRR